MTTAKSTSPPTRNYNMSQREAELGYPTTRPHHGNPRLSFSLPSLSEMELPRPVRSHGLPSKLDLLKVSHSSSSLSRSPTPSMTETEVDESSIPLKPRGGCSTPSPLSSTLPLSPSPSPSRSLAPLPSPSSSSTPTPALAGAQSKPFSTWVPDDSLRFINPNFLSSAGKQTLEQLNVQGNGGKRKASACTEVSKDGAGDGSQGDSLNAGDEVQEAEKQVEESERPKKMGRPLGRDDLTIPTPSPLPYMFPARERPSTFPSSLMNRSSSRPPQTTTSKPQLHRSQTDDLDLLRQVKSNNLSIPSTSTTASASSSHIPPYVTAAKPARVQPHLHQHHQHQQPGRHHVQTSPAQFPYPHHAPAPTGRQQHRHQHYAPPFTHAPLYHPPSTSNYTFTPNQDRDQRVGSKPIERPNTTNRQRGRSGHRVGDRGQSPVNAHLLQSNTAVPPQSPNSSSNATSPSAPSVETSTPDDSETGSAKIPLPPGDWRWAYIRRYGGRGRGQSGG